MDKLVILGAGQQGRNCKRLALEVGIEPVAFVDDFIDGYVEGIPVYRSIEAIDGYEELKYIVAIGELTARRKFIEKIKEHNLEAVNLIDPTAAIEEGASIGNGNYIYKFVSVYASATIGDHNIINTNAVLATDCVIGENCNISMGCNICGDVHIGDDSYIGHNATVASGYNVGSGAYVEACSLVKQDVIDGAYVSGVPAKMK